MTLELKQNSDLPTDKVFDQAAHWIMLLPEKTTSSLWLRVPHGQTIKKFRERLDKPRDNQVVIMDLPNKRHSRLSQACIKPDIDSFTLLGLARKLVAAHLDFHPRILSVMVMGFDGEQTERLTEALISAVLAVSANLPRYKKEKDKLRPPQELHTYGCFRKDGFSRSFAMAEANALARRLSMLPPNKLRPAEYRKEVEKLARANKWSYQFFGIKELKKKKAGAFLAVCQGSPVADAGIVKLSYRPGKGKSRKLSLVGKGICYDTGGHSLKPPKYMFGMHEDMQGSAVALGTFLALSQLKVGFAIDCWLALAMNHIGPRAYKPNDVVTACDGTSIEVVNTDAEGRMVLSDT
ncbi:MAG: leucyl aminopeptidase family protein, partial [Gammaproteobacteria bacterium]|nr:leucyl aminopeptidase family protein [Gammaproteobacteria bacterium]